MGFNTTLNNKSGIDLTPRQLAVMGERTGSGRAVSIRQIAKKLGLTKDIVFEDLKKIKESSWYNEQVERMKALGGYAFANVFANILAGKYEAGKDYMKGMGVWRDKLEVSGSIEQKLSDDEITDKAKQVILEVIEQAKVKQGVKGDVSRETDKVKRIESAHDQKPPTPKPA